MLNTMSLAETLEGLLDKEYVAKFKEAIQVIKLLGV